MTRQKVKPESACTKKFGNPLEEKEALCRMLKGKRVVFAVCDGDFDLERVTLTYSIFKRLRVGDNQVVNYSTFFTEETTADILVLRSSTMFDQNIDKLIESLKRFRKNNPQSAVILCVYNHRLFQKLIPLADSGIVNTIVNRPPADYALLRKGIEILDRLKQNSQRSTVKMPSIDSIQGRTIVFITDPLNMRSESKLLPHAFRRLRTSDESMVADYPAFFKTPENFSAEILILRSSKLFFSTLNILKRSLEVFRSNNPEAIVILSLLDLDLLPKAEEFRKHGLVDHIDTKLEDDFALIEKGAMLLQ